MIGSYPWLGPAMKPGEHQALMELAKADDHGVFLPTHPIRLGEKLVGYFSVGTPGFPVTMAWLSTKDLKARQSFGLINTVENHVALLGAKGMCLPVPKHSPFHPLMKSMGYVNGGNYDFFVKEF